MSYLSRTQVSSTAGGRTNTLSMWFKRQSFKASGEQHMFEARVDGNNYTTVRFHNDRLQWLTVNSGSTTGNVRTNRVFRDTSGWYHLVIQTDTTQGTASNRVKIYINGELQTDLESSSYPTQNYYTYWCDNNTVMTVGKSNGVYSGYVADLGFFDTQTYAPTIFGQTNSNGVWTPKTTWSGVSYGNNGFRLKFEDASNMGLDSSGEGHNFSNSSVPTNPKMTDTPSNNFCTWNKNAAHTSLVVYNGAQSIENSNNSAWRTALGTLAVSKGKWYWEFKNGATGDSPYIILGAARTDTLFNSYIATQNQGPWRSTTGWGMQNNGTKIHNNSSASYGSSFSSHSVVGCKLDLDNGTIGFLQGSDLGNAYTGITTGDNIFFTPMASIGEADNGTDVQLHLNTGNSSTNDDFTNADAAGQGKFAYSVPSGYFALCTKNIETYG
tara:strand:- start:3767 stop:5080 length:1314 start_codon:yes stop_codon:yes gene_type:complete